VDVKAKGGTEAAFDAVEVSAVAGLSVAVEARAGGTPTPWRWTCRCGPTESSTPRTAGAPASADAGLVLQLPDGIKYSSRWMLVTVGPSLKTVGRGPGAVRFHGAARERRARALCLPPWGGTDGSELLAKAGGAAYARRAGAAMWTPGV